MNPYVMLALMAASAAGAIFGNQKKQISPEWLAQNFGPAAATQEAQDMFNQVINSPRGQQLMNSAAESGQRMGNQINQQAASAGLTPMGGAASGTGVFATSAGAQAGNRAMSDAQGNLMNAIIPSAQQAINERMNAYLGVAQQGGLPTPTSATWQQIGNAAGTALGYGMKKPDTNIYTGGGNSQLAISPQPSSGPGSLNVPVPTPMPSPIPGMSSNQEQSRGTLPQNVGLNRPNPAFSNLFATNQGGGGTGTRMSRFTGFTGA